MSFPRNFERIYKKIAIRLTEDGWASPSRKNIVSDVQARELIISIMSEVLSEVDNGYSLRIPDLIRLKKIKFRNGKSYIETVDLRGNKKGG